MPLPLFSNGAVLTAAQLNALVDALNTIDTLVDVPIPTFQANILDTNDYAGLNGGAEREWRYLILHQAINRYLIYAYEWQNPGGGPYIGLYVANNPTPYVLPTTAGMNYGSIDMQSLSIPAGAAYVVRVVVDRGTGGAFKLHWLFERSWA